LVRLLVRGPPLRIFLLRFPLLTHIYRSISYGTHFPSGPSV
jgi:hypothetical protein